MVKLIKKEFNCNHEADLNGKQAVIYNREKEHEKISEFLTKTIQLGASGLMYLCGHPGTGKTSSLNSVLSEVQSNGKYRFKPLLFNAMAFPDVKCFAIQLYERLHEAYYNEPPRRQMNRQNHDEEDMADMLERLLTKISDDPSMPQKVIVIDEVDCFQQNEKSFNTIITRVLKGSSKQSKTKTTIIGIANSVDLPFKKKNSAIGQRDSMLLFQPYSFEDIESVVEQKKNSLFKTCVPGTDHPHRNFIKDIFFNLIDERAMTFMCKRISQSCGDIRVVFDIMKTALQMLNEKIDNLDLSQFKDLTKIKPLL